MPSFWRKPTPAEDGVPQPEAFVASASRVTRAGVRLHSGNSDQSWQQEAWDFYDTVPEFRYVCDWKSQAASRVKLFITTVDESGEPDTDAAGPIPFATTFLGGPAIQSQIVAAMVLHLEVVGNCYLIGRVLDYGGEQWDVYSLDDLRDLGGGIIGIDDGGGVDIPLDPDTSVVIKIWRPHPRKHAEPNAPARAARAPLREIIRADQSIAAQIDSRLTGAGILLVPKELSFTISGSGQDAGPGEDSGADPFMTALTESMMTAIADPNSVEAVVPILVRGPADQLEKVRLLTLSTAVSESVGSMRDAAVSRLARGLDVAAEVLLGMGDTNHLSGWQIEESNAKVHLAAPMELICGALTEQYLWPAIRGIVADYRKYVVWYDMAQLVQRPDQSSNAQQVFDRGELSGTALRRYNQFTENDAPTEDERRHRDLLEVAGKVPVAAPAVLSELLREIGVDAQVVPSTSARGKPAIAMQPAGPGSQGRGVSAREPVESRPLPDTQADGIVATAEALTLRALETAGKRLVGRNRFKFEHLPAWEYHTVPGMAVTPTSAVRLLDGAWQTCPTILSAAGVAHIDKFTAALHNYTADLLCAGQTHTRDGLRAALSGMGLI